MDKRESEEVVKLLKKANEQLEHISSRLEELCDSSEKMKGETKKKMLVYVPSLIVRLERKTITTSMLTLNYYFPTIYDMSSPH